MAHSILAIVRGVSYEEINVEIERLLNTNFRTLYTSIPNDCTFYHAKFFRVSTNKNANMSLGTAIGFSYCVHLAIKPKTASDYTDLEKTT